MPCVAADEPRPIGRGSRFARRWHDTPSDYGAPKVMSLETRAKPISDLQAPITEVIRDLAEGASLSPVRPGI